MTKGIFLLNSDSFADIYGPDEQTDIAQLVEIIAPPQSAASLHDTPAILAEADVILSGWGCPVLDAAFLATAPNLKAVFYGAGSIKEIVTDAFWNKKVPITSSYSANAVPVVEYTLGQVLFCLKRGWQHALAIRRDRRYSGRMTVPGAYGSTVGIISLGMIGRMVCRQLQRFDLHLLAYDPYVQTEDVAGMEVEFCSLEEIFRRSDVVSLHTPWLSETEDMITGEHFAMMKEGATFINTDRGAIVCEKEMIEVLQRRPDLFALLDVTWPEPPVSDSLLYALENVVITPHIAGSLDNECRRMGRIVVDELRRFVNGEPLLWSIPHAQAAIMA